MVLAGRRRVNSSVMMADQFCSNVLTALDAVQIIDAATGSLGVMVVSVGYIIAADIPGN
jgi:hypothetical protein